MRGVGAQRVLTDLVSLVRHAVELDDELVPYPELVRRRYEDWLAAQEAGGRTFTEEQRWWLDRIAETTRREPEREQRRFPGTASCSAGAAGLRPGGCLGRSCRRCWKR